MSNIIFSAQLFEPKETERTGVKIPAGIHEVTFNGFIVEEDYLDILFINDSGQVANKRLWHKVKPFGTDTMADAEVKRNTTNLGNLVHLMMKLIGPELTSKFSGNGYEDFVTKAVSILEKQKGRKIFLKVIMDRDNKYTEIPKYFPYLSTSAEGLKVSPKELGDRPEEKKEASSGPNL